MFSVIYSVPLSILNSSFQDSLRSTVAWSPECTDWSACWRCRGPTSPCQRCCSTASACQCCLHAASGHQCCLPTGSGHQRCLHAASSHHCCLPSGSACPCCHHSGWKLQGCGSIHGTCHRHVVPEQLRCWQLPSHTLHV